MTPKELNEIAKKLVAQLGDAHKATIDVVPPGWFTPVELSKAMGVDRRTVLRWAKEAGAEKRNFRIRRDKMSKKVPHYRLK